MQKHDEKSFVKTFKTVVLIILGVLVLSAIAIYNDYEDGRETIFGKKESVQKKEVHQ